MTTSLHHPLALTLTLLQETVTIAMFSLELTELAFGHVDRNNEASRTLEFSGGPVRRSFGLPLVGFPPIMWDFDFLFILNYPQSKGGKELDVARWAGVVNRVALLLQKCACARACSICARWHADWRQTVTAVVLGIIAGKDDCARSQIRFSNPVKLDPTRRDGNFVGIPDYRFGLKILPTRTTSIDCAFAYADREGVAQVCWTASPAFLNSLQRHGTTSSNTTRWSRLPPS